MKYRITEICTSRGRVVYIPEYKYKYIPFWFMFGNFLMGVVCDSMWEAKYYIEKDKKERSFSGSSYEKKHYHN